MHSDERFRSTTNWLLLGLAGQELWHLWPRLRREHLPAKTYLERSGSLSSKVYFIESGVVSSLETGDVRDPIEVGVIGREGLIGTSAIADLIPQRDSLVQIEGQALVLDCVQLQKCLSASPGLRSFLSRYVQAQMVQISLAASAGVRANVQQRLARKLLMYHDRVGADDLPLTHENISLMLGVRRASVTNAVHNLEAECLIKAQRGLITIRDRAGLERYCGRFYGVAETRYAEIMSDTPRTACVE
ncbi:Crp/Fnr family transcriptional regulator [Novosphingobium sp. M1R2S20]|uniref:Crp/Fnr family transcriptional regulator n=1 Tax=Novosphingobium rhizovicinum TaxID=3228928 RepID=A0ABV3RBD6_9SPHN